MAEIPVAGDVLIWAREFRGLSPAEAADKLGIPIDELQQYEAEAKKPSLTKFEKMAAVYRLPLATLFRRTRPPAPAAPSDFRTFEGEPPQQSFDFRVALSNVRTFQAALRVIGSEDENFRRPQLRQYAFARDPFEQGAVERRAIGTSVERQLQWNAGDGFRHWRAIVERLGVSVYLQKFELADCRGFSVWDDEALPAIVINKAERSENAWVFTLIHEYAHLLIRRPGISDFNARNPTEAFCNRFAAAFLMPEIALRRILHEWPLRPIEWDDVTIREAARALKVSARALAIRLEELGKAPEGFNRRFAGAGVVREREDSGGSYVRTRLSEIGGRYTESILNALDRDVIDSVHASEALGLGPPHIDRAREYLRRQRELADVG